MYKIVAVNLGSTSSKIAYYEDRRCIKTTNIEHPARELKAFEQILDQYEYRKNKIIEFLQTMGVDYKALDAIVSRGGHTHPIPGGCYAITDNMLDEIRSGRFGRHACDVGVFIAGALAGEGHALAMVVDPPVTDEFHPLARFSGLPSLPRKSSFHALNQRAAAKKYAGEQQKCYEELNLIGVHMGGGISIAVHQRGQMVDANNALTGDGPFSTNRAGTLPAGQLVELCFSGEYTKNQLMGQINGRGGMMAWLGENDIKTIQEKALAGNAHYKECLDAMLYQTCKAIGSAAPVLCGQVDAIILTGGIVHSDYVVGYLREHCGFIAPLAVYPGEFEMEALALGAYDVLEKKEVLKEI